MYTSATAAVTPYPGARALHRQAHGVTSTPAAYRRAAYESTCIHKPTRAIPSRLLVVKRQGEICPALVSRSFQHFVASVLVKWQQCPTGNPLKITMRHSNISGAPRGLTRDTGSIVSQQYPQRELLHCRQASKASETDAVFTENQTQWYC